METTAEKIKTLVSQKGITYAAISRETCIPIDALSKTFLGKRKLTAEEMVKICSFIGIDLNDLM